MAGLAPKRSLDPTAIHVDRAAEIAGLVAKDTPEDADLVVLEDSAAGWAKRKALISAIGGGVAAGGGGSLNGGIGGGAPGTGSGGIGVQIPTGLPDADPQGAIQDGLDGRLFLCHFDGGHGSAVFTDAATDGDYAPHTLTPAGGLVQSNVQVKWGASSGLFGSGKWLNVGTTGSEDMAGVRAKALSFDVQLYPNSWHGNWSELLSWYDGTAYGGIEIDSAGIPRFFKYDGASNAWIGATTSLTLTTWQHLAIVLNPYKQQYGIAFDGVWQPIVGTSSIGETLGRSVMPLALFSNPLRLGNLWTGTGTYYCDMFMDEPRLIVGADNIPSEYDGATNFSPPTGAYT